MQAIWKNKQVEILELKTVVVEMNNKIKPQGQF